MRGYNSENYAHEQVKTKLSEYFLIKRLAVFLHVYRFWMLGALLILVAARVIEAWVPIRMGQMAQIILTHVGNANIQNVELFNQILHSGFILFIFLLLNYGLDILNVCIKNSIGQKAIFNLRIRLYEHILKLPMAYYDKTAIGRLMTRTIHDVEQINQLLTESLLPLFGSIILFLGILIGLFLINWHVGIVFCLIFPLIWLLVNHFRRNQRACYHLIRTIVSAMNTFIQEHLMGVNVIRNFGIEGSEKKKFDQLNYDNYEANLTASKQFAFFFSGIEFLQNLTLILVFLTLIYLSPIGSHFQAGTFFTVNLYGLMIFRPLLDLAERYNILQSALAAAERIFDLLEVPVESKGPPQSLSLHQVESIQFENVWFAYIKEEWVLKDFSFILKKGESVALVGLTGSGKTSVINLLLRFYDFQKGHILINGEDIRRYSLDDLRRQFSPILQDPVIFSGTIFDNIALYDPNIGLEQVEAASNYVRLDPLVGKFPEGYQHRLKERGTSLSAGERQLIALARAVVHERNILILDEATANIDIPTETVIQRALKKILSNRTALIIAHRLSTIKDVNRILVMNQGTIVESGTHEELLASRGLYEKLFHLQFSI